jgi:hypothetical protein
MFARGEHDRDVVRDGGHEVQPGRELALVRRQWQAGRVREPLYLNVNLFHV